MTGTTQSSRGEFKAGIPGVGIGTATCGVHTGEICQGVFFVDGQKKPVRGLQTLPCNLFKATAEFVQDEEDGIRVEPAWMSKSKAAAERTLGFLDVELGKRNGLLRISVNWPDDILKCGFGTSTATVIAAVDATALAVTGLELPRETTNKIAVEAEQAADSLAFGNRSLLFAHRQGDVIEDFGFSLPKTQALAFISDPAGVDTLAMTPAEYNEEQEQTFGMLRASLRGAVKRRDARMVARVAEASARINQEFLPTRGWEEILDIRRAVAADGVAVSHSGTVAVLLWTPNASDLPGRMDYSQTQLRNKLGIPSEHVWQFDFGH